MDREYTLGGPLYSILVGGLKGGNLDKIVKFMN